MTAVSVSNLRQSFNNLQADLNCGYVYVFTSSIELILKAAETKEGIAACIEASAPAILIKCMTAHWHYHRQNVIDQCCEAISIIAAYDEGKIACVKAGAISTILKVVGANEDAWLALESLCHNAESTREFCEAGIPSKLVKFSESGKMSEKAAKACLKIMAWLSREENGFEACMKAGAPVAATKALAAFSDSAPVALAACTALLHFASAEAEDGVSACLAAGALDAVAHAMLAHESSLAISEVGTRALCLFASNSTGFPVADVLRAAVGALTAHRSSYDVALFGAMLIRHALVAVDSDHTIRIDQELSTSSESTRKAVVHAVGKTPTAIVKAMEEHRSSASVAYSCCTAAVYVASFNKAMAVGLLVSGMATTVTDAMRRHCSSAAFMETGCQVLSLLSEFDENRHCITADAISAVVVAINLHTASDAVRAYGCNALHHMGAGDIGAQACVAAGAVHAVVKSLRSHTLSERVAVACCAAIRRLAISDAGEAVCISAGAPPAIVAVLAIYASSQDVALASASALGNLSTSDLGEAACVAAGAPLAIVRIMKIHKDTVAVVDEGRRALRNMSDSVDGLAACKAAGDPTGTPGCCIQ